MVSTVKLGSKNIEKKMSEKIKNATNKCQSRKQTKTFDVWEEEDVNKMVQFFFVEGEWMPPEGDYLQ